MANLLKLAQIQGGVQLQSDVTKLLKDAYDATKQITTLRYPDQKGEDGNVVKGKLKNVNEALTDLAAAITLINGEGEGAGDSLASIAAGLKELKNKKVKDMVRVPARITVTEKEDNEGKTYFEYGFNTTTPVAAIPGIQECSATLYTADNRVIVTESGNAAEVIINIVGDEEKVVEYELPDAFYVMNDSGKIVPLAADSAVKFFVQGEWTLSTIPEDALLDNEELSLIAYSDAINKVVVQMASNKELLDNVIKAIGDQAIKDIVENEVASISAKIKVLQDSAFEKTLTKGAEESDDEFAARQAAETARAAKAAVKGGDVVTTVRAKDVAADDKIATEKAVRTAIDDVAVTVSSKDEAMDTRVSALEAGFGVTVELEQEEGEDDEAFAARQAAALAAAKAKATVKVADVATDVPAEASEASDEKIASQKAVATAVAGAKADAKDAKDAADLANNNINKMTAVLKDLQDVAVMITERVLKANITVERDEDDKIVSEKITLGNVPNSRMVFMTVNGLEYNEQNSEGLFGQFAITRPAEGPDGATIEDAVLTWDAAKAGFTLSEVVDDYVIVKYYSGKWKNVTLDTELIEYATKGYVDSIITIEDIITIEEIESGE